MNTGLVRKLDDDYFKRVEAIEFAVKYDDGRDPRGILRADIVLVGVSRTSKTPLSQYLAHKRYKVGERTFSASKWNRQKSCSGTS